MQSIVDVIATQRSHLANGQLELADAVYGPIFCFKGTDAPVAPFPACGTGTDVDSALGCAASARE